MTFSFRPTLQRISQGLLVALFFLLPFSKAAVEILFPLLAITWGFLCFTGGRTPSVWKRPSTQILLAMLLGYVAVCTGSVLFSTDPVLSLTGLLRKTLEYILYFLIAADIASEPRVVGRSLQALLWASVLVILWAVIQEVIVLRNINPYDPFTGRRLYYSRMVGPYQNPNDLATFLMVTGLILLAQLFSDPKNFGPPRWVLTILTLACLAWTRSGAGLLGFGIGAGFLIFFSPKRKVVWLLCGMMLLLPLILFWSRESDLGKILSFSDDAWKERFQMWTVAWRMIAAKPWTGVGLNTFMANYQHYADDPSQWPAYAHNCYLQIAAETGGVGLLIFLGFLGVFFAGLLYRGHPLSPKIRSYQLGLAAALMAFLVQSAFDTNFYALRQAALFWTLAGLSVGLTQSTVKPDTLS